MRRFNFGSNSSGSLDRGHTNNESMNSLFATNEAEDAKEEAEICKMQAITTLHAQLSAATEKLDVAQKSLTNQKKEIYDLKEEGRLMRAEIDDLRVMLDDIENDEKSDLRRLEDLRLQAMPLDLDFQRISGALDVVPHSFQALSESFVTESREIMGKVEDFLSLAVKENFWKNKIMMNLHHIQAVKVRLRKQTLLINEAISLEEKSLNDQLADEESSLAIVQGCIDAIERKNAALISERGMDKSYFPPYQTFKRSTGGSYRPPETSKNNETSNFADEISGSNSFASRLQSTKAEQRSSPIVNSIPAVSDSSSSSGKESTCHGCHKSGHFIGQCPECYRCQTCHKHHHKSKGCPLLQANQSSTAAAAEVDALGDNHATRDQQFFYDTPTTKNRINSGGTKGPNPSPSAAERLIGSGSQAPSRNTTNESAIYPYNNQQVTQQHARQEQGHITHTVTHTVIEELMESHHDFDKTRDRDRGGRDDFASNVAVNDDRPWFHLMKRRRSVTETVNRNNDGVSAFEYSDDYRQGGLQSSEEYGNYPHPALENAVTPIKQTGESRASNSREVSSHLSKSHSGFRSGLDILLDSER